MITHVTHSFNMICIDKLAWMGICPRKPVGHLKKQNHAASHSVPGTGVFAGPYNRQPKTWHSMCMLYMCIITSVWFWNGTLAWMGVFSRFPEEDSSPTWQRAILSMRQIPQQGPSERHNHWMTQHVHEFSSITNSVWFWDDIRALTCGPVR